MNFATNTGNKSNPKCALPALNGKYANRFSIPAHQNVCYIIVYSEKFPYQYFDFIKLVVYKHDQNTLKAFIWHTHMHLFTALYMYMSIVYVCIYFWGFFSKNTITTTFDNAYEASLLSSSSSNGMRCAIDGERIRCHQVWAR